MKLLPRPQTVLSKKEVNGTNHSRVWTIASVIKYTVLRVVIRERTV